MRVELTLCALLLTACPTRGKVVQHGDSIELDFGAAEPRVPLTRQPDGHLTARLGGRDIAAETLDRGRQQYLLHCSACHGFHGDGRGDSARGMVPPPRDFRRGRFKFGGDANGALPSDDELFHIVRNGLAGTAMQPWPVSDDALDAIVQYLKTLSPRWRTGTQIEADTVGREDPWGSARATEAIARGEALYHGLAQCVACHPAYVPRERVIAWTREMTGTAADPRIDLWAGRLVYEEGYRDSVPSTDFARQPVRAGSTVEALHRTISAGIDGTPMPSWRDTLPERDLWALAYYVRSVITARR